MKSAFKSFQIFLLLCGVFGADQDEVKSVSVMEGDSVTLDPDLTQVKKIYLIEWRFGDPVIAQTDGNDISYPSHTEIFRDRLQLDQTGSLTIKNMKIKHSGLYKLQISHSSGTSKGKFNVTVYESTSDAGKAGIKSMSLIEGNPVALQTDVPQLYGDELIVWRFGDEGKLIAKVDIEAKSSPLYYDERFRDRLQLDHQTGSLTITNSRTTDSGVYTVKISSNKQKFFQTYSVTISDPGVSPGAVAGIVVVVVLLVAAAAAGVVYYFRPRISQLPSETLSKSLEDNVTLNPDPEIQTGDEIQWLFGVEDTLIAEIKKETGKMIIHHGPDRIFKNKLELDETTGSLTIKSVSTLHTGLYTLKIRRGRKTLYKRFQVSVNERKINVMEGDVVTLKPTAEINKDDLVLWQFGDAGLLTGIAMIKRETGKIFTYDHVAGGIFKDRLELDKTTGSLTITNTRTAHSGLYNLQITSSSGVSDQTFIVTVKDKVVEKYLKEEDSVTLNPDTKIQRADQILWMFGDEDDLIAQIKGGTVETYDDAIERFKGRLKLNNTTGSLTIKNILTEHTGLYKLQIISSSRETLNKKFKVSINLTDKVENKFLKEGESVTLNPDTEIQRDDQILWMFGFNNNLIAQISKGTGETYDDANKRFKDRLKLDKTTGSLTISNISAEHVGLYKLQKISSSGKILYKTFIVSMLYKVEEKSVNKGGSVTLNLHTENTEIQGDDQILWMFGHKSSLIAHISGGTGETYDGDKNIFKDRLKLDNMTGSLTIRNISYEHTGHYKLQIISSSRETLNKKFKVSINLRKKSVMNENNDSTEERVNKSVTVEMPLLGRENLDGVNDEEGTSSL